MVLNIFIGIYEDYDPWNRRLRSINAPFFATYCVHKYRFLYISNNGKTKRNLHLSAILRCEEVRYIFCIYKSAQISCSPAHLNIEMPRPRSTLMLPVFSSYALEDAIHFVEFQMMPRQINCLPTCISDSYFTQKQFTLLTLLIYVKIVRKFPRLVLFHISAPGY